MLLVQSFVNKSLIISECDDYDSMCNTANSVVEQCKAAIPTLPSTSATEGFITQICKGNSVSACQNCKSTLFSSLFLIRRPRKLRSLVYLLDALSRRSQPFPMRRLDDYVLRCPSMAYLLQLLMFHRSINLCLFNLRITTCCRRPTSCQPLRTNAFYDRLHHQQPLHQRQCDKNIRLHWKQHSRRYLHRNAENDRFEKITLKLANLMQIVSLILNFALVLALQNYVKLVLLACHRVCKYNRISLQCVDKCLCLVAIHV